MTEIIPDVTTNSFGYSGDNLRTLTDGKNQTTTWNYDEYGRATNKVDAALVEVFRWYYDANGRMTNRWTPAKLDTFYSYDPVGNLVFVNYATSPDITLEYNLLNQLTNMVDAVGATRYSYTAAGLLSSEDGPWADDTVSFAYQNRLRTGLTLAQPMASPWIQTSAYDAAHRLETLSSPAGAFAYRYDPAAQGLLRSLELPNGAGAYHTFNSVGRLTATILTNSAGTLLNRHDYTPNLAGQRERQTRHSGSFVDYTYDNAGQLLTALGKEQGGIVDRLNEQFRYAYDPAGNLNWRTNNGFVQEFAVNSVNELTTIGRSGTLTVAGTTTSPATEVTVNSLEADLYSDTTFAKDGFGLVDGDNTFTAIAHDSYGRVDTSTVVSHLPVSVSFVYDLNGNLRTNGTRVFEYDDENQLVANWVAAAWKSEFVYDGHKRRRIQRDYRWSGTAWVMTNLTRFVYDGSVILQHRDGDNRPVLTLTRGLDLSGSFQGAGGIGGLLAFTQPSVIEPRHFYYHSDGSGNVTALLNTNQVVVGRYLYDPFGSTLSLQGAAAELNPYRFSSKPVHSLSGNYDFLYRWYAPELQRWLNRDPIGELGGLNLYGFVYNHPINFVDSFGLDSYTAYTMPVRNAPYPGAPGYTDPFGNWSPTFCFSCHGNTPTSDFYRQQSVLANMLDFGVLAYEQLLGAGLTMGFGSIARNMENAAYLRNLPQMNRACGLAAEARVQQQLLAEGNTLLGVHVGARTSDGLRFIDRLVQTPSGQMLAVEVKSGDAVRDAQQLLRDHVMATQGATLVGRNAPRALRGQTFIIQTIERR